MCMLRHFSPLTFPTHSLFQTHPCAKTCTYLDHWSVNSASVDLNCEQWAALKLWVFTCVFWHGMTSPAKSGLTRGPISIPARAWSNTLKGRCQTSKSFKCLLVSSFNTRVLCQKEHLFAHATATSILPKCREVDKWQSWREANNVLTLNLSSQGLWSSWIIWRGFPCSRMTASLPPSTPLPPWTPAQWPLSYRGI